ncbi:PAP2-domain-containing protein [Auriculariales sp. MPI-PUGE-AT-0066]|nr:PAP2-domain-containing protein [Auriculariales sp. MPI-PUGE-AT-0066]
MAARGLALLWHTFVQRAGQLDLTLSPSVTITRLRCHKYRLGDAIYIAHAVMATFWLILLPSLFLKLAIPALFTVLLLVPLTSQFFFPAIPVLQWVLTFYCSRFIPAHLRPSISVSLLPTLETVLYGANISDILTRFTHPALDIIAWIPYGVIHFSGPFILAFFLWLFAPKGALKFYAKAFGYMSFTGVVIQIILPCAAPWYELIHGLTPADYSMKGSPGGLARIDALFHSSAYSIAFSNAPVVFGAFPSLHSGFSTMTALQISHFFGQSANGAPNWRRTAAWVYVGVLYWSTMYLTHHYLVDVTGGACLATAFFYIFLPTEFVQSVAPVPRSKYELYDIDVEDGAGGEGGHSYRKAGFRRPHSNTFSSTSSADEPLDSAAPLNGLTDAESATNPAAGDQDDDGDMGVAYRPQPGAVPFLARFGRKSRKQPSAANPAHKRTASIISLIGPDERSADDGWSTTSAPWGIVPPAGLPRTGSNSNVRASRVGVNGDVTTRAAATIGDAHTAEGP